MVLENSTSSWPSSSSSLCDNTAAYLRALALSSVAGFDKLSIKLLGRTISGRSDIGSDGNVDIAVFVATAVVGITVAGIFLTKLVGGGSLCCLPVPEQCRPGWKGEEVERTELKVAGSSSIQCYCPASGKSLGLINPATPDGIDRAIARAQEAQTEWAKTSFSQRRKVLQTLLKFVLENQENISTAACLDSGKTRIDSSFGEILVTVEKLKWTIKHGERALKAESRPTNFLMMYKVNEVRWEPLGVVAACVSWKYFHNLLGPIISALFSGNAVVVKGSEATAWSSTYFTNIARGALIACGHSPNLVQSIICWPSVAPHLTSHPSISHLTFIGSRPVAHAVCASAAEALTPVCVELGGKDASIILDDVKNLDKVSSILMRGVFQSSGQNCIGIERVIACAGIYDKLCALIEPRVKNLRVGSALDDGEGIDVGAMVSPASFDKLEHLIADAVNRGARLLAGGKRLHHPRYPKGHYFAPTLIVDVTPDMAIAQEELFAPVFVLMKATDVTDAIRIANSTEYGLGASVFGSNRAHLEQVVSEIKSGMVSVNDFAVYYAVQLPFGGVKGSGYGRFAGEEGLRGLCNTKSICRDRFPALLSTSIPPPLDYPIKSAQKGWDMCMGIVELGYGETIVRRVKGLGRLIRSGM
ncbi:Aldedh-domain-containing protein [Xylona heveae TC161]|uniref:aldehyde dehydrogenase (NAD(+)) n=1 Tax=Xylona heveae (strain CBS 132557 / TC161) TaxID=1328760 RepID=A0A165FBZ7_XYLHT|nr:Aldedh-domain-containing protein [Xylona heveae TC161]KZF20804.1 Aldedh-domain-containing protein [Xylona heveae TC161]